MNNNTSVQQAYPCANAMVSDISKTDTKNLPIVQRPLLLIGNFNSQELTSLLKTGYQYSLIGTKEFIKNSKLFIYKNITGVIIKHEHSLHLFKCLELIKKKGIQLNIPILFYGPATTATQKVRNTGIIDEVINNLADSESIKFKLGFLVKVKKVLLSKFTLPGKINTVKSKVGYSGKRLFDITVSLVLLIILLPVLLLIALIIKLESAGPVFYIANRAGRHYKIFPCIKFRTMMVGADKMLEKMSHLNQYKSDDDQATFIKIKDDPRITRIGNFLRNSSLDELPQLINVLLGHMSLVGNRPLPLYEATSLTDDHKSNRFCASAGLTGLWQVMKRGEQEMSAAERIDLDIQYAKNASPLVDFWILLKTPFAMVQKTNA